MSDDRAFIFCRGCHRSFGRNSDHPDAAGRNGPVTITEVSVDPLWVSGGTATAVGVSGTVAGEQRFYFIPFMTVDQAKPHVGERCDISWQWHSEFDWLLGDGGSVREGRMVTNFHCEPASR